MSMARAMLQIVMIAYDTRGKAGASRYKAMSDGSERKGQKENSKHAPPCRRAFRRMQAIVRAHAGNREVLLPVSTPSSVSLCIYTVVLACREVSVDSLVSVFKLYTRRIFGPIIPVYSDSFISWGASAPTLLLTQ
jgi:hypothetical protein